jgi:exosortase
VWETTTPRGDLLTSKGSDYCFWLKTAFVLGLIVLLYLRVLLDLSLDWWNDPALSQGVLIPPLALYIAWLRRSNTLSLPPVTDCRGLFAVTLSSILFTIGKLGAEFFLMRISFILLIAGMIWTYWGLARLRTLAFPLCLLITTVPLPKVVYNSISTPLQLFASHASADIARTLGATVYLDGNIINLARITLGVEEACSGLNSLSSLIVASPLLAFLLCTRLRSRLILIPSAIPLAISVNIVRIAGTALLADYRPELATGFYHFFSGWLVFILGLSGLYIFARLLHVWLD